MSYRDMCFPSQDKRLYPKPSIHNSKIESNDGNKSDKHVVYWRPDGCVISWWIWVNCRLVPYPLHKEGLVPGTEIMSVNG